MSELVDRLFDGSTELLFATLSPLVPISSAELLWSLGSGSLIYALPWVLWLACGVAALWLCHRKWVR